MVQRKATQFVFNDFSTYSSVTAMLHAGTQLVLSTIKTEEFNLDWLCSTKLLII